MLTDPRVIRLWRLVRSALAAPPGLERKALAITMGVLCHTVFAAAILSMMYGMWHGLSHGVGSLAEPWALPANLALILQFPLVHSALLTARGRAVLARLVPGSHGAILGSTTYAIVASLQLLALFWLWTPTGVVWWRAEGPGLLALGAAYGAAWALLAKAIFDAGADLQSGALGWLSLLADRKPAYPDMPSLGLFSLIRQPIYLAFACTLWTVPTWTPDQLALATLWTAYCVSAPMLKERRLAAQHGARFDRYRRSVPYMIPRTRERLFRHGHREE